MDIFFVVDVFIDVSLALIVVSQGLYLSCLVLPSIADDSLKLLHNYLDIIETFHLTLNNYCFFRITVEYIKLTLRPLQDGASSGTQQ